MCKTSSIKSELANDRNIIDIITTDVCTYCKQDGRSPRFIHLSAKFGKICPHCAEDFHSRPATDEELATSYRPFVERYVAGMKRYIADMIRIWGSLDNVPKDEDLDLMDDSGCSSRLSDGTCEALDGPCLSPGLTHKHGLVCATASAELGDPKFSKDVPAFAKIRSEEAYQ